MHKFVFGFLFATVLLSGSAVSAQSSSLQPGASNLQPQSSQTQNTQSLQQVNNNVQTSGGGDVFSQSQLPSLGVVSDPKQATPDTVVAATSSSVEKSTAGPSNWSKIWMLLAVVSAICALLILKIHNNSTPIEITESAIAVPKQTKPETINKTTKTKAKKKKKKAHHR